MIVTVPAVVSSPKNRLVVKCKLHRCALDEAHKDIHTEISVSLYYLRNIIIALLFVGLLTNNRFDNENSLSIYIREFISVNFAISANVKNHKF